ncbi:reproductive homeobox on X chromosome 2, partial [Sigmodon hispidus]
RHSDFAGLVTRFFSVSPVSDAKARTVLLDGEGTNEEASGQGQPGRGAAAAEGEGAGELSGEGLVDDWNQEGHGASGGDPEKEEQPQEPVHEGTGDNEAVQLVPALTTHVQPMPRAVCRVQSVSVTVPRPGLQPVPVPSVQSMA